MPKDPMNDDDYTGNDEQIADLKAYVEELQEQLAAIAPTKPEQPESRAETDQPMPTKWKAVTEERYDEMLGAVPPVVFERHGFLVGEAWRDKTCEITGAIRAAFAAFVRVDGKHFEATEPMTPAEFRAVNPRALELAR